LDESFRFVEPDDEQREQLHPSVARPIARSLGSDLGAVRVHTGKASAEAAGTLGARAFTVGSSIHLGDGERTTDLELIAHEVAHALQQDAAGPRVPLFDPRPRAGDVHALEREAQAAAGAVLAGQPAAVSGRAGGRRVQRQPRSGAAPAVSPATAAAQAFDAIVRAEYPVPARDWVAGTRYDPAERDVRPDLGGGRAGRVTFVLGLAVTPPAVRAALLAVLGWRLANGVLTDADVGVAIVQERLRQMLGRELRALRAGAAVEPGARSELDRMLAISTPLPAAATLAATGTATVTLGAVTVRILPDRRAGTQNQTDFRLIPSRVQVGAPRLGRDRRVSALPAALPVVPVVEIQTTYAARGPQAALDPVMAASAYGRGTAPSDRDTTLRFHEGSHGSDYLEFIRTHPYRTFNGRVGMTVREWQAEARAFLDAHAAWARGMGRYSLCNTDCVGTTIDDVNQGTRGYRLQCTGCGP
jgi:hypothetical protein